MTNALFQGGGQRDRVLTLAEVPPPTRSPTSPSHWVDNVGWGDFGVYGGTTPTPRIDKLRSEGILNVGFPDQASGDGHTLALNGLGLRQATALKVNVYVAALYVTQASTDANAILGAPSAKQFILHFVRNVSRSDLTKAWDEGFQANAADQLPSLKARIEKLETAMTDMKSGERLLLGGPCR